MSEAAVVLEEEGGPDSGDGSHPVEGDGTPATTGPLKVGDVFRETDKGRFIVVGFKPDGSPKLQHRVKPKWKKGETGNALGGRKPGEIRLFSYIQEKTKDGKALADFALDVLGGKVDRTTVRDRLVALQWLTDRGYGKALERVDVTSGGEKVGGAAPVMPLEMFAEIAELRRALDAKLVGRGSGARCDGRALPPAVQGGDPVQPAQSDRPASEVPEPPES